MDWLETLFDVAQLGTAISSRRKLKDLVDQGQSKEFTESLIAELKNEVFKYKQIMESILEKEDVPSLTKALGMELLKQKIIESEITAEMFPEFSDKEYVSKVFKDIKKSYNLLIENLTDEEKQEFRDFFVTEAEKDKYQYYIDNIESYRKYKQQKEKVSKNIEIPSYMLSYYEKQAVEEVKAFEEQHQVQLIENIDIEIGGDFNKAKSMISSNIHSSQISKILKKENLSPEFFLENSKPGLVIATFERTLLPIGGNARVLIDNEPVMGLESGESKSIQIKLGKHKICYEAKGMIGGWVKRHTKEIDFNENKSFKINLNRKDIIEE